MRFKKTEVCQSCSKIKNVCQTCLLDLHYHLPVQVRDSLLKLDSAVPKMEANRMFLTQKLENEVALRPNNESLVDYDKADPMGKDVLKSLARTKPYYKRNLPHVCSFYLKGTCNRGPECPYRYQVYFPWYRSLSSRHEIDMKDEQLKTQAIKDRYYGTNDPVANKILEALPEQFDAQTEDKTITTLILFGSMEKMTDSLLRPLFITFGEIESIRIIHASNCAFLKYKEREPAEGAYEKYKSKGLKINDTLYKLAWAKPKRNK